MPKNAWTASLNWHGFGSKPCFILNAGDSALSDSHSFLPDDFLGVPSKIGRRVPFVLRRTDVVPAAVPVAGTLSDNRRMGFSWENLSLTARRQERRPMVTCRGTFHGGGVDFHG